MISRLRVICHPIALLCRFFIKRSILFTVDKMMPKFGRPPRTGWARYLYPNGDLYLGQFHQGLRHGKGAYISSAGVKYAGQWSSDQRHGEGVYIHERSGFMYSGQWVSDKRYGVGQLLSRSGCYWGQFVANKFNGNVGRKSFRLVKIE